MSSIRRVDRVLLTLIVLIGAALRFHGIGAHCFWTDEIASVQLSAGHPLGVFSMPTDRLLTGGFWSSDPFANSALAVIRAVRGDTHPPLYLLTLHFWRQLFGSGDGPTRSLSAVCGLIAIVAAWDAVRSLHGVAAAHWTAALLAVATPQIEFAQEARSYMMLTMWSAFVAAAIGRIVAHGATRTRTIVLSLFLLAAMATHYYGVSMLAAVAAFAVLQQPRIRKSILSACCVAVVVFAVTLGPLVWIQRSFFHGNMTWIADDEPGLFWRTLGRIIGLPMSWFITPLESSMNLAAIASVLLVLPWLRIRAVPRLALWLFMIYSAVGLAAAADLTNHSQTLNLIRYTLHATVPVTALVAALLVDLRGWIKHVLPLCLLIACLIGLPQAYEQSSKLNWDRLSAELSSAAGPTEPIVFYQESSQDWHGPLLQLGVTRYSQLWKRPQLAITQPIDGGTQDALIDRKTFWVISGTETPPIERFIPGCIRTGRVIPAPYVGSAIQYRLESGPATSSIPRQTALAR